MAGAACEKGRRDYCSAEAGRLAEPAAAADAGQRFGASSEQRQTLTEQLCLFNEAEALADDKAAEPEQEQITYKRRKQTGKREMDLSIAIIKNSSSS